MDEANLLDSVMDDVIVVGDEPPAIVHELNPYSMGQREHGRAPLAVTQLGSTEGPHLDESNVHTRV
jgi:hypothetical protein